MTLTIDALVEARPDGGWDVRSPGVGVYRGRPRAGSPRGAGDQIGTLALLNRTLDLILPVGVEGIVTDVTILDRAVPIEYGQTLFTLSPVVGVSVASGNTGTHATAGQAGLPEGTMPVPSPIDGIFYRRASPASPPFVAVGDTVETGRTLGLIEAMKSFNAVTYGGPGLPERAVIVEVRAGDASEVRQGAVLVVIRPV